jgi:hypothetical protein
VRRAIKYAAAGGLLAGIVLGGGTFVLGAIPIDVMLDVGGLRIHLSADSPLIVLLIVPMALAGALAGGFTAYVVVFGCRELDRFAESRERAWRRHRRPIGWLTLAGALAAVLLARGLPVPPGLYPHVVDERTAHLRWPRLEAQDPWQAIEILQMTALAARGDSLVQRVQRTATRAFFVFQPQIQAVALSILGGTLGSWCALVCATWLVSRRAGGEAAFWSLWLLAGGFFLGIVAIGGFGYAFGALGPGSPAEIYLYSFVNTGVPAAWIALAAAAGNCIFGLLGLSVRRRSALAGLFTAANAGAILILGTTTRLTLALNPPVPLTRGVGVELPTTAWHILTYFEGHLVAPFMGIAPSAPLATLGVVIGVGLVFGGAFYGMNAGDVEAARRP